MKKLSKNLAMYIMCFGMFVAVFCAMTLKAEVANVTSGYLGDNNGIYWTYDADTKILTITGEIIKLKDCTPIGSVSYVFGDLASLKPVEFDNFDNLNVTSMGGMFSRCTSLKSLDLRRV